jgi:hypothetical protein
MDDAVRIQRLLDRTEIIELKHAYLRAADACEPDRMVSFFTDEDFVASYDPAADDIVGKDAIHQWYRQKLTGVVASSHHVTNEEVEFLDADTAVLRCYLYSWQRYTDFPDTADRHRWCRYRDVWVRRDGRWQMKSLTLLVAGELWGSEPTGRQGEYFGWDL